MEDLSQWDYATDFTMDEAAALIVGLNPIYKGTNKKIFRSHLAEPVFRRMHDARAMALIATEHGSPKTTDSLTHLGLERREKSANPDTGKTIAADLVFSSNQDYRIRRTEIVRWLDANELKSVYQFDLNRVKQCEKITSSRWPWGDRHTELLGHLEAAALEFWAKYDSSNVKRTAPKNDTVINWLLARHVSRKMAEAIATMLRPDGLPTGPRT